jgi:hypothetical protein
MCAVKDDATDLKMDASSTLFTTLNYIKLAVDVLMLYDLYLSHLVIESLIYFTTLVCCFRKFC